MSFPLEAHKIAKENGYKGVEYQWIIDSTRKGQNLLSIDIFTEAELKVMYKYCFAYKELPKKLYQKVSLRIKERLNKH